jgi:quercetin dioxygenase-like cupin family protein
MQTRSSMFPTAVLAPVLALTLAFTVAQAQPPGVTNQPLGFGQAPYAAAVDGPADIAFARVSLEPGRASGWHSHPGPGWVVVTVGTLSLYRVDGCQTVYPAGTAFLEEPGDVHDARNETAEPVEFLISFTVPAGAAVLNPESGNPATCR